MDSRKCQTCAASPHGRDNSQFDLVVFGLCPILFLGLRRRGTIAAQGCFLWPFSGKGILAMGTEVCS